MIAYLGLGSNIEPIVNIDNAKRELLHQFGVVRFSRIFESMAVGFEGDNFLNLVAEVHTAMPLETLMSLIKQIEVGLGRIPASERFSSRCIDIDILLCGDYICDEPIQLPSEDILENAYVLWPLAELAPDLVHPTEKLSYGRLWQQFDKSCQQLWPVG